MYPPISPGRSLIYSLRSCEPRHWGRRLVVVKRGVAVLGAGNFFNKLLFWWLKTDETAASKPSSYYTCITGSKVSSSK